ncbi:hypothetical protein ES706_01403 [subsurface metagenome]
MKRKIIMLMLSVVLIAGLILTGCVEPAAPPTDEVPGPAPEKPFELCICGGTIGGGGNICAIVWAAVAKEFLGIDSTVISYPGEAHTKVVIDGLADIASGYPDKSWAAYIGEGVAYPGVPQTQLRSLFWRYAATMQFIVLRDSDIKTFRDMVGRRISPGKEGMGSVYKFKYMCEALGLDPDKDFSLVYMGHKEAGAALIAGKIACYIAASAPPNPALAEADLVHPMRLVPVSEEDIEICLQHPGFAFMSSELVPPVYYHMEEPTLTLAGPDDMICSTDLPEDIAYELVKNYVEHPEFVGLYHQGMMLLLQDGTQREWTKYARGLPFHAGTMRYLDEIGWEVREDRIPPEYNR